MGDLSPSDDLQHPISSLPLRTARNILDAVRFQRQLSVKVPHCVLRWDNVQVWYQTSQGPRVTLHNCSGSLRSGEMLAIMGPSGAGKSTLMDTLTMRKSVGHISGEVTLNGRRRGDDFFLAATYVPQEDNLVPTDTVREVMEFYADLTLPLHTPAYKRKSVVTERLQSVGLADRETQMVGGKLPGGITIRGLSGGERRRLGIAAGVVHSPPLVFLDEPTTGLDAFSALCVVESLRTMATQGHAVACTIHQPRQALLDMFDQVAFLAAGRLVYMGAPRGVKNWLSEVGLWDPERALTASLSDIVLDCITTGFEKPVNQYGQHTLRDEKDVERLAHEHRRKQALSPSASGGGLHLWQSAALSGGRPHVFWQYWTLQRQQFRAVRRSPATLAARVGLHALVGLLIGAVYYDVEVHFVQGATGWRRWLPIPLQRVTSMPKDRTGVLFLLQLSLAVTPNCAMSFFVEDKRYYTRESAARLYGAIPYHVATAVTEALVCAVNGALAAWLVAALAGLPLSGRRRLTVLHVVSHHMCASALVQMCARITPNSDIAFVFTAGYIILQMLFSNVIVNLSTVNPFLGGARWVCSLYYGMAGIVEVEFGGAQELGLPLGDMVAATFSISVGNGRVLDHVGCLAVVWIFYMILSTIGFLALKFLNKPQI